jgi:CBS domain-containing protein
MNTVEDIIREKGRRVHTIGPESTVYDAIERMVALNIGALVVRDGHALCGMITERDYLRRVALRGRSSKTTSVRDIMTRPIISVTLGTLVNECMRLMTEQRIRHLPVVEAGQLMGLVSIGDVVKLRMRDQVTQIQHLTDYIQGAPVSLYTE